MKTSVFLVAASVLMGSLWSSAGVRFEPRAPIRIGTYDNRAVAVAWAASKHNPVGEKMKELEAAKQAKDQRKIRELETWGQEHQRLLHFQGFGRVPVTDLLEPVEADLKKLLQDKGLSAITLHCDAVASEVELVDVTLDLVKMFEPNERTLTWVEQMKDKKPLSLLELAKLPADK